MRGSVAAASSHDSFVAPSPKSGALGVWQPPKAPSVSQFGAIAKAGWHREKPKSMAVTGRSEETRSAHVPPDWLVAQAAVNDSMRQCHDAYGNEHDGVGSELRENVPTPGLPPADPQALGSPHQMNAHLRKWSPLYIEAPAINAHRLPVVLQGRPVVVVIPSHPGADYLEADPYLPWVFRPLTPIVLYGYDASTKRVKGHKHLCVIRWFREQCFFYTGVEPNAKLYPLQG